MFAAGAQSAIYGGATCGVFAALQAFAMSGAAVSAGAMAAGCISIIAGAIIAGTGLIAMMA